MDNPNLIPQCHTDINLDDSLMPQDNEMTFDCDTVFDSTLPNEYIPFIHQQNEPEEDNGNLSIYDVIQWLLRENNLNEYDYSMHEDNESITVDNQSMASDNNTVLNSEDEEREDLEVRKKEAFTLFEQLAGSNVQDKYQRLTSGNPSPIHLVFGDYHGWLCTRKGRYIEKENLRIEAYDQWRDFIHETYGVDFSNVKKDTFRHDYKKLYIHQDLHDQAAQGMINNDDIREYNR